MKKGLLILFPGIRYSVDCPLLYYTRIAYEHAGYECVPITSYDVVASDDTDMNKVANAAAGNVKKILDKYDFNDYEHVVFAEKSIGTMIGMMIEDDLSLKDVIHLVYTPIADTIPLMQKERNILCVVAGDKDSHIDIKKLRAVSKPHGITVSKITGVGHRLETGESIEKDLNILTQVITVLAEPSHVDDYIKEKKKREEKKKEEHKKDKNEVKKEDKNKASSKPESTTSDEDKKNRKKKKGVTERPVKPTNIRPFIPRDIDELMELWLIGNMQANPFIPKKFWNKNFGEIERILGLAKVFVYEENGKIVGFVASMETVMVGIYVAEASRGRGIGKVLIDRMKETMGKLELSVYRKNERAIGFFTREGFNPNDIRLDEVNKEEEILMEW